MSGDTFRRVFDGDIAQCGCRWIFDDPRHVERGVRGWVLDLCVFHRQASDALGAKFERLQKRRGK